MALAIGGKGRRRTSTTRDHELLAPIGPASCVMRACPAGSSVNHSYPLAPHTHQSAHRRWRHVRDGPSDVQKTVQQGAPDHIGEKSWLIIITTMTTIMMTIR